MSALQELKRRKIVQWALAYLAGAWVVLQLVDILGDQFGWVAAIQRGATILLGFGLFIALVLAWYHGEKGRQRVSGPELLMVAGILVVAGVAVAFVRADSGTAAIALDPVESATTVVPERSIAVLPLQNNSPGNEYDYFSAAMTEEITSALTQVPELRVTSRSSASKFADSGLTVREFALEQLGVAHVLEGSLQRVGDTVRITVQLIDARTDEHLWSETYQREMGDVLEVQVDIARQVADRLASSLMDRQSRRIVAELADPAAYDLYARSYGAGDDLERQTDLLRRAVELDPSFPFAWFKLAEAYYRRAEDPASPWLDSARVALGRAKEAARGTDFHDYLEAMEALAFGGDPQAAIRTLREQVPSKGGSELHLRNLAHLVAVEGDLVDAVRYMRRANALDPLDPLDLAAEGNWCARLGLFDRAEDLLLRSVELDPRSNAAWAWERLIALRLLDGRYDEALAAVDSLARYGDSHLPHLGRVRLWAGRPDRALMAFEEAVDPGRLAQEPAWAPDVAHARLLAGDSLAGRRVLDRAEADLGTPAAQYPEGDPFTRLRIAAVRSDTAAATHALRVYRKDGGVQGIRIARSPLFERVRQDPAFRAELDALLDRVARMRRQVEQILENPV